MDDRVRKLENQMLEISSKIDTRTLATHDLLEEFTAKINVKISSLNEEMLRLNWPAPIVMDSVLGFSSIS